VDDPNHQNYIFNPQGTNQPLARNMGNTMAHQARLGTTFSKYFFSEEQKTFFFAVLKHHRPDLYDNFFLDKHLNVTDDQT